MSTPSSSPNQDDVQPELDERAVARQERGALIFSIVAVIMILVIASPCLCYFGAGLFQGVNILRTGQQNNPARQGYQRQGADWRGNYKRPERYNRKFEPTKEGQEPAPKNDDVNP